MATCVTPQWSNQWTPTANLTVNLSSQTETTATFSWSLQYVTYAGLTASTNGYGRAYNVQIGGSTVAEGSFNINKVTTTTIANGTHTVNKSTSAQSISFSVSFNFDITWSGSYGGTKSASGSIDISAITSYTISYNANGGSGAPSAQTKWHGTNLTLSSSVPSKTGYTFRGWNDRTSGDPKWGAGGTYTWNQNCTLYALWQALTYTVSYNANGGSGAPSAQTKTYGITLTLSSTKPTRSNYNFKGWGTSSSATTVAYASGGSYTANSSIILYAIWEIAYTKPNISNFSAIRCNSSGTATEEGTYALVKFNWSTFQTVTGITIAWSSALGGSGSTTVSASGTSGSVSKVIGGSIVTDYSYSISVTVADGGGSSSASLVLSGASFSIDFYPSKAGGVAFGKSAENESIFDVNLDARFNKVLRIGTHIRLWADNEGGNYQFKGGDGTLWEMDAYNGNLRIFNFSNTTYPGITIDKGGTLHALGMQMYNSGGMWINGKTQTKCIVAKQFDSDGAYFTFFRANTYSNHVFNIGGIGDKIGFYGFHKDRTSNGYDWVTCWNVDDGWLYHSKSMTVEGISYFNSGANFQNNNIAGVRELVFMQGTSGHITNHDNQQMYFAASPESNFEMFYGVRENGWRLCPHVNGYISLGSPSYKWGPIYSTTSTITTSDKNAKKNVHSLTDKHIDFFMKLQPVSFMFIDGTSGRTHIGFIAQDVEEAMEECGLTDLDFAGFCKDQKHEIIEKEVDGNTVYEDTPVEGEYIYSLRYEEFIALNTHVIQHLNKKYEDLKKDVEDLKKVVFGE